MLRAAEKLRCTKEPYIEDVGPQRVKSLNFGVLSGEEIKKSAEVQIWNGGIYDNDHNPVKHGLIDSRMGPAHKKINCATCHGKYDDCPGHFGYLKLILPVYNVGYINSILNILKCICKACGRILLTDKEHKDFLKKIRNPKLDVLRKNEIMKKVRDRCKASQCLRCGYKNGVVKKAKASVILVEDFSKILDRRADEYRSALAHLKEKASLQSMHYYLTPVKVLALFKKMPDEDCELLNLCVRPEKLIVTDIAIPPAPIRPSVRVDSSRSNEDSLTSILKNIMNTNSILREDLNGAAPPFKCLDLWAHLQVQVVEYINSDSPAVQDSINRGLVQRLKGKQGRFRSNLNGKRVEFTGRTVISPDPNLKITEVAIPILMAQVLTYPERVSRHNIEKLRQCVRNGPAKYPGANFVTLPDGTRLHLKYERKNVANQLKYGSVVERHLEDGDIVLFNRQPSLHRMSIMSHRARIMPWRTLRFNESVCNPYNADFDGDEMNLHVPQTEEARTEAFMLMGVQNNLCTPKNGEILVASTQDFLTSSFLITRKDTFYDRAAFSLMCSYIGDGMDSIDLPTPALIKPIELWTGKQLFSVLVRPNANTKVFLNLIVQERIHADGIKKNRIRLKKYKNEKIHDQDLEKLDKGHDNDLETMCPCDGYVYFRNSELICGQLGKITLGNGNKNGLFSVLLRDYNPEVAASCMNRLAKLSARWIGNHGFSIGIGDVQPGEHIKQQSKKEIDIGYRECSSFIKVFQEGKLEVKPGASAAETLEQKISTELNNIRGKAGDVCTENLHWRNSPLIMFQCGSKGSLDNISQMIACVGQQSVGGKRALNGFMDRTLPHFPIKSNTPSAKGFVANSFCAGLTATEFFFHTMAGREGLVDTAVKTADTGYMSRRLMKGLEDLSLLYDQTVRTASGDVVQFVYGGDGLDPAKMEGNDSIPLNLDQLYMKVLSTYPCRPDESLSPSEIKEFVEKRSSKYDMSPEGGCSSVFKDLLLKFLQRRVEVLCKTRSKLKLPEAGQMEDSSITEKFAATMAGISAKQLQVFLETCISRYHRKRLEAGAAIGAIGAQSIGEPGTQMTLKTFHFAGLASMNITQGVPRIKEIINAAKNISTPIIKATLLGDNKEVSARIVKAEIEKTFLDEIAEVKSVFNGRPYISIVIDGERIRALHMKDSLDSIKRSILNHPKIKLKSEHISILGNGRLRIFPPVSDRYKIKFELHSLKKMLSKVIVKGISTVGRAVFNSRYKEDKYDLAVQGTNLLAVMGTPGVDASKTVSNHIMEIKQTLGIEAARNSIINEIQYAMQSMRIDIRHMMLLADIMTYKGDVLGITRFGISKMKESVLMLASFEKTQDHLFDASFNARIDQIKGVSECIIMGIPVELGTGILKVRQRIDELPVFKYGSDPILSGVGKSS